MVEIARDVLALYLLITFLGLVWVGMNALADFVSWILTQISAWMDARKERREQKDGNTKLL